MDLRFSPHSPEATQNKEELINIVMSFFVALQDKLGLTTSDVYAAATRLRQIESDRVARFVAEYSGKSMTIEEAREAVKNFR